MMGEKSALFCDSWEIDPRKIWDKALESKYFEKYGYNVADYANSLMDHPETFWYPQVHLFLFANGVLGTIITSLLRR